MAFFSSDVTLDCYHCLACVVGGSTLIKNLSCCKLYECTLLCTPHLYTCQTAFVHVLENTQALGISDQVWRHPGKTLSRLLHVLWRLHTLVNALLVSQIQKINVEHVSLRGCLQFCPRGCLYISNPNGVCHVDTYINFVYGSNINHYIKMNWMYM